MSELANRIGALVSAARRWGYVEATSWLLSDKLNAERQVKVAEQELRDYLARHHRAAVNYHLGEE